MSTFQLQMKVRDYECDAEGIVNNANYLHYFEHTRHEFCSAHGMSFRRMRQENMAPVVCRIEADYRSSLGLGDEFTSHLDMERRGPRFLFHQWITNAEGQVCVDAVITIVNVIDGRPTRGDELAQSLDLR
jgi:acyl-CoA thioester hydrolase